MVIKLVIYEKSEQLLKEKEDLEKMLYILDEVATSALVRCKSLEPFVTQNIYGDYEVIIEYTQEVRTFPSTFFDDMILIHENFGLTFGYSFGYLVKYSLIYNGIYVVAF